MKTSVNTGLSRRVALAAFAAALLCVSPPAFADETEDAAVAQALRQNAAESSYGSDQNLKNEKIAFSRSAPPASVASPYELMEQASPYQVMAGSVIPGTLVNGMNSDLPGAVIGQVSMNVYDSVTGSHLLIPQGTRLVGTYDTRTAYAQTRGHVIWQRMIFPNGKSIQLPSMAGADREGYSGFKDKVRSHYARVVWSALIGGALIGGIAAATDSDDNSFEEEASDSIDSNLSSAVNQVVSKNLNIAPTIIIRPGYRFNILVDRDITLEPYTD